MRKLPVGGESVSVPDDLTGKLLIATPLIGDPNFGRTVLFVIEHNDEGSLAVVVNRASETSVAETLPSWDQKLAEPAVMFDGGPVGESSIVALAISEATNEDALESVAGLPSVHTVDLDSDAVITQTLVTTMRLFSGYAGWAPGQVEGEIAAGAWFVAEATTGDIFSPIPHQVRESVLRRQRNPSRYFTHYPDDPRWN